jgi:putative pyruvate formate lyase activating enzyme
MWEEPVISGVRGSGTMFFSGCNLRCVFCQNKKISRSAAGRVYSESELADAMLRLRDRGAHNINLVTPTHYSGELARVLESVKPKLNGLPIVWNSGGYESVETLKMLDGLVDVYLPDVKYFSSELSAKYSSAPDYFEVAMDAVGEMYRQVGDPRIEIESIELDKETVREVPLIKKGVIVRHLLLPGCRRDSIRVVEELAKRFSPESLKISIMRQYTPDFVDRERYPELARRVTSFEYDSVVKRAAELGFDGYVQSAESATKDYTPDFDE